MCFNTSITFFNSQSPCFYEGDAKRGKKKIMVPIFRLLCLVFKRNDSVECDCSKGILQHNSCKSSHNLKLNVRVVFNLVPRTEV